MIIFLIATATACFTIVLILVHCALSQSLLNSLQIDDNTNHNSLWIRPSSGLEFNELDTNKDESTPELLLYNDYNPMKYSKPTEPVRRPKFWKRANFWRKRANFWRRDINL